MTRTRFVAALLGSLVALRAASVAAGPLSGTVVIDGKPAAGAVVSAIPFEEPLEKVRRQLRGEAEPRALSSATAGPGGAFSLTVPAVPGKVTWFRVRITARGGVPAEVPGAFDASETDDLGELALRKAEVLAGRVTGPGGRPVAGARVTLTARGRFDPSFGPDPVPEVTTTAPDGTFRFAAAASERNDLLVEAAALAPGRVVDAKAGAQGRAITLGAGTPLPGSVKKRDGKPAAGALVRYEADGLETRWVETGADGAFVLPDLPSRRGSVVVDAGDDGFALALAVTPGPGHEALKLVLAPPTVLEGRTLDVATLKAVPRVKLTVGEGEELRIARSGADGRFGVRGLRPGEATVRADEPRHVPWVRRRVPVDKGTTKTLDVPLTRGATLSGRIVDEDGRPVAEAKVVVSPGDEGQGRFRPVSRARAGDPGARIRSRGDGTFSATRIPPGENQRLTAEHPEYEKGKIGGISLQPGETRAGAVVTLRRGLVVTGTVKDPEGNPIAGAELTLSASRVASSSRGGMRMQMVLGGPSDAPTARSGADGRFELKGIPAGDWAFTAKAPGRATEVVDPVKLVRDTRPDPIDVVLSPGAAIAGFVLRKTGGGAEGYAVIPRPSGKPATGGFGPGGVTPTGPDGAFFLDGLKAGESYDLQLFGGAARGPGPTKRGIAAPAADVEWIVEGAGRIEGVAVDGRTGQALASFEVSFQPDRFGGGVMMWGGRRAGGRGSGRAGDPILVEAADGRFVLEDVPAGKWLVVVTAKGYQTGRASGVVVEEATTTDGVEIRVSPGSTLKVRVTDAKSGRGVPEAQVGFAGEAGGASLQSPGGDLLTDVDGRVEAEGLAPGKVKVSVAHADYTDRTESVELKEGGSSVEVALSRGSSLGGVVLSETRQPAPGAEVALEGANAPGRGFGSGGGESAATDASGRFRFDHLSPGRYTLRASVPGQTAEPVEAIVVAGESKEDVSLVLAGGATIRGVVSGLSGTLRAGVGVSAGGPGEYGASARTGADGRFELSGAPAGTISLRATVGDFLSGSTRTASGSVTIVEGQKEVEAEIVFEGSGALSGRVTRGGAPVPEARLFLGAPKGGSSASGRTDESGSYRIEGLTPGDYTVNVQAAAAAGRGVSKEVRIDGEASLDVELPMARLFGIVVDGSTKQPLADARVTANLDGGAAGRPGFASSDSNGRFFVDDVEPGAYTLTLRRSGYQEASDTVSATEAGGDAGTIEMTRGEGLELRVRDGIYQIPLRSVNVRVRDGAGATVTSTWLSLDGDGKGELSSLRPGRYTLVLGTNGYATQVFDGILVPGAPLPVALTPGGSVEVRPGEASRAKGEATLRNVQGQPHPYRSWGAEGRVPLPAAGVQLLENLAPGSYTLAADGVAPKGFTVTEGGRTVVELP